MSDEMSDELTAESKCQLVYPRRIRSYACKWDGDVVLLLGTLNLTADDFEDGEAPIPGHNFVIENDDNEVTISPGDWVVAETGPCSRVWALSDFEFKTRFESAL